MKQEDRCIRDRQLINRILDYWWRRGCHDAPSARLQMMSTWIKQAAIDNAEFIIDQFGDVGRIKFRTGNDRTMFLLRFK